MTIQNIHTKQCPGTEEQKPHSVPATHEYFSYNVHKGDGFCAYCRVCSAFVQRKWKRENKDKVRAAKARYRAKLKRREMG
jgi:hypothetical protein